IRVGQRNLLIGRGQHLLLDRFQALHLGRQLGKLLLEVRRLRSEGFRWFLQVGGVELAQIPRHALLDLSKPALHLRAREILVAIVDRFELAAVDSDKGRPLWTLVSVIRNRLAAGGYGNS